jgi:hypothetical protein
MASVKTAVMVNPGELAQLAKGESQVLQQGGHGRPLRVPILMIKKLAIREPKIRNCNFMETKWLADLAGVWEPNSSSGFTRKVSINEQARRDNNLLKIHHYVLSVVGYLEASVQVLALRPATDQAFAILIEMSFGRLSYCWQHLRMSSRSCSCSVTSENFHGAYLLGI